MSGGSLDYAYTKVNDIADTLTRKACSPLHRAFIKHLLLVSDALHDLEWVLSDDYAPGDEVAAIEKVVSMKLRLDTAIEEGKAARDNLNYLLEMAAKEKTA